MNWERAIAIAAVGSFLLADMLFVVYLVTRDRRERITFQEITDSNRQFQQLMVDNMSAALSVVAKALDKNSATIERQISSETPKVRA